MTTPFVIMALPRSRTAWLSSFLTCGNWTCGHEELRHVRELDDVKIWLGQEFVGSAETSAGPWWRLLLAIRPDTKILLVRRKPEDVVASFLALPNLIWNEDVVRKQITRLDVKLDQIEARLGVSSFRYESLREEAVCKAIWELTVGGSPPSGRWRRFNQTNIQVSVPAMFRYVDAFGSKLAKASAEAKLASIRTMKGMN